VAKERKVVSGFPIYSGFPGPSIGLQLVFEAGIFFCLNLQHLLCEELEGDNYYLYVVIGLRAGGTPKLCIIQNPCKHLKPDMPFRISVTNWQHAVRYEVSFAPKEGLQESR